MNAKEVVIVSGVRTAIGTMGGTLKDYHQHDLGGKVIEEAVKRAGIEPKLVDEVIENVEHVHAGGRGEQRQADQTQRKGHQGGRHDPTQVELVADRRDNHLENTDQ